MEETTPYQVSTVTRYDERSCPKRRIEATDGLLRESVECLSQHYPAHPVGAAACDRSVDLRPTRKTG
jgi:hypothetical protein